MTATNRYNSVVRRGAIGLLTVATMALLGTIGSATFAADFGGTAPVIRAVTLTDDPMPWGNSTIGAEAKGAAPTWAAASLTDDPTPWGNSTVAALSSAVTASSAEVSPVPGLLDDTRLDLVIPDEIAALASVLDPDQAGAVVALWSAIIGAGLP